MLLRRREMNDFLAVFVLHLAVDELEELDREVATLEVEHQAKTLEREVLRLLFDVGTRIATGTVAIDDVLLNLLRLAVHCNVDDAAIDDYFLEHILQTSEITFLAFNLSLGVSSIFHDSLSVEVRVIALQIIWCVLFYYSFIV